MSGYICGYRGERGRGHRGLEGGLGNIWKHGNYGGEHLG